jgi:hypothetical protein
VPFAPPFTPGDLKKDPTRPSLMSSIHERALAMAVSSASRLSGFIGALADGACTIPFTAAKLGAAQGSVILASGCQACMLAPNVRLSWNVAQHKAITTSDLDAALIRWAESEGCEALSPAALRRRLTKLNF